jgi:hypothetical protein
VIEVSQATRRHTWPPFATRHCHEWLGGNNLRPAQTSQVGYVKPLWSDSKIGWDLVSIGHDCPATMSRFPDPPL